MESLGLDTMGGVFILPVLGFLLGLVLNGCRNTTDASVKEIRRRRSVSSLRTPGGTPRGRGSPVSSPRKSIYLSPVSLNRNKPSPPSSNAEFFGSDTYRNCNHVDSPISRIYQPSPRSSPRSSLRRIACGGREVNNGGNFAREEEVERRNSFSHVNLKTSGLDSFVPSSRSSRRGSAPTSSSLCAADTRRKESDVHVSNDAETAQKKEQQEHQNQQQTSKGDSTEEEEEEEISADMFKKSLSIVGALV